MLNKPTKVIFHCYATPDTPGESKFSIDDVRRWHLERGWQDVGYNFLISREGKIEEGRPVNKAGAHTKGQNSSSIGIAYEGSHLPTADQWLSIIYLYRKIRDTYKIDYLSWHGHSEYANKDCPGFDPDTLRKILATVS